MPQGNYNITIDSIPDLDGWGFDFYWGPTDWMQWYNLNKQAKGKSFASDLFISWWQKGQSYGAAQNDWLTFNSSFRDWAKNEGLYDRMNPNFIDGIVSTVDNIGGNIEDAVSGTAIALKYLLPSLAVVAFVAIAYYLFNLNKLKALA
jgi:hypothetical protein